MQRPRGIFKESLPDPTAAPFLTREERPDATASSLVPPGCVARKENRWRSPPADFLMRLRRNFGQESPGKGYRVAFAPVRRVNS